MKSNPMSSRFRIVGLVQVRFMQYFAKKDKVLHAQHVKNRRMSIAERAGKKSCETDTSIQRFAEFSTGVKYPTALLLLLLSLLLLLLSLLLLLLSLLLLLLSLLLLLLLCILTFSLLWQVSARRTSEIHSRLRSRFRSSPLPSFACRSGPFLPVTGTCKCQLEAGGDKRRFNAKQMEHCQCPSREQAGCVSYI